MSPTLLCIPNVSEGRRPEVIRKLAEAVTSVDGVKLLDTHTDRDHNRSVFTFAGEAPHVSRAAFVLTETAIPFIDVGAHRGVHPRIGAVDVIPFVPWKDATMTDAVNTAHRLGLEIAEYLTMPVYYYEQASRSEQRRALSSIRRGGLDRLREVIMLDEWRPDAGPAALHPSAGAVVVGARGPLIAFNVNLATNRLEIAQEIAKTIRERDGGLPAVRALGVALESRRIVQVTINLTDYRTTPLKTVYEAVEREATQRGVPILESELVGMIPRGATFEGMKKALRISNFTLHKVIEDQPGT